MAESELAKYQPSGTGIVPHSMEGAMQMAQFMAEAKLVPAHLRNSPGDCLLVINQAVRWGLDPFAVAQATCVVQGKLCYEGKLIAAVLTSTGCIKGRPDYEFSGEGDNRTIKVTACTSDGKPRTIIGCVRDWKSNNRYWQAQPDDMLIYRGIRQWARRYAPEAVLGILTPDEMIEEKKATEAPPAAGRKPMQAQVEVTQDTKQAPPPQAEDPILDAEEVELPSEEEQDRIYALLAEIASADDHMRLAEIKNKLQLAYGNDVPKELKDAWKTRKQETR